MTKLGITENRKGPSDTTDYNSFSSSMPSKASGLFVLCVYPYVDVELYMSYM